MKHLLVLLTALALTAAHAAADTYPRQPLVDAVHYAFQLTLGDESDEIAGTATILLRFTGSGATTVALDLASAASGKGMTVVDVTSAGWS
jgi:aminopeptidase N